MPLPLSLSPAPDPSTSALVLLVIPTAPPPEKPSRKRWVSVAKAAALLVALIAALTPFASGWLTADGTRESADTNSLAARREQFYERDVPRCARHHTRRARLVCRRNARTAIKVTASQTPLN